jgi:predicted nucleotide-binding protein
LSRFSLVRPRSEALKAFRKQVSLGDSIADDEYDDLQDAIDDETRWNLYNEELLRRFFSDDQLLTEYKALRLPKYDLDDWDDEEVGNTHTDRVRERVTFLRSVVDRLPLIPESPEEEARTRTKTPSSGSAPARPRVFIIHGHDEAAKSQTARFIERLGLTAVILHEQPNQGRTIIEKLERHSEVAFAVALLTPDDVGGSASKSILKPRARQNVIFELGRFENQLGRERVCILLTPGVELPSDLAGVAYIEMDSSGGWQFKLAKELKSAGLPVDLNLI